MVEFQEVMMQFDRMCLHNRHNNICPMGCDMRGINPNQCQKMAFVRPAEFERLVMKWAADHPEPVYPTWYEFLTNVYPTAWQIIAEKHIPADMAQKLGLKPKEGQHE